MTPEQKAAFIMARTASAFGQMFAMHAENAVQVFHGFTPVNTRVDFERVIVEQGLDPNALITFFQD